MLRGSSDIVNAADSIIGIKRKTGKNQLQINHIKNRSGEEISNKIIIIDSGEKKDMCYMYESDKEADTAKVLSREETCAEDIIKLLKEKKLKIFARRDLNILENKYTKDVISKSLRILKSEEQIIDDGKIGGKYKKYMFKENSPQTSL
jgi:hypothetical protein